ncbi:MAG: tetratricopeptide repeat protein [Gemmatimonadetes bacterium]|nr:tetratricopeptide repeat protein [Gemmatimonadota bacterium]
MSRTFVLVPILALAVAGAATGVWANRSLACLSGAEPSRSGATPEVSARTSDIEHRDRNIAFYAERAQRDAYSAADRAQLAALYLQRARETSAVEDYRRAEDYARASLALRSFRNGKAHLALASSLLAQHRFAEALDAAEALVALEPERPSYRALLGEIQLELGHYDDARATFRALFAARDNLAVAPRLARWAELEGRPGEAWKVLGAARDEAARRKDLPREQVAWFHLRVADFALRYGRLREARRVLERGLDVAPDDPRLLAAAARLAAARRHWREAIRYGERAGAGADIATLGLVGDGYAALGDIARAEAYWRRADAAGVKRPEPYNRQWTLFLLDHRWRLPEALALLREEIRGRQDVYGYDQLAWALYRTGDYAGARLAMRQALRLGTVDAMIFFHAGMIEQALGSNTAARSYLRAALETNPYFHPFQVEESRRVLRELRELERQ